MKKTRWVLCIALLLIVLCGAAIAESEATIWLVKPAKPTGWVNLRSEPSLESEGLARAKLDQEVIVMDEDGEWAQVIFDGQAGYMKTEFLEKTDTRVLTDKAAVTPPTAKAGNAAAMQALASVMKNESTFFSVPTDGYTPTEGKYTLLQDFLKNTNDKEVVFRTEQFAVIDLTGDGTPEIILHLKPIGFYEVLHHEAGTVYGYMLSERALADLRQDGVFAWANGADDYGYGRLMLRADKYEVDTTVPASQSALAVWHDFTPENINQYVR